MRLLSVFVFSIVLASFIICKGYCAEPATAGISEEEYKIYSQLLKELAASASYVLYDETADTGKRGMTGFEDNTVKYIEEQSGVKITGEIKNDFMEKNKQPHRFEKKFDKDISVILVSENEINEIFKAEDGWDEFYRRYPSSSGTVRFSRVGFNKSGDMALVYFGNQKDWLAGVGYYIILKKEGGKWTVLNAIMAWIS